MEASFDPKIASLEGLQEYRKEIDHEIFLRKRQRDILNLKWFSFLSCTSEWDRLGFIAQSMAPHPDETWCGLSWNDVMHDGVVIYWPKEDLLEAIPFCHVFGLWAGRGWREQPEFIGFLDRDLFQIFTGRRL